MLFFSFQPFLFIYASNCCELFQKGHRSINIMRPVPIMSDSCASCKLHWLAAYIYQKGTLLKIYYTQTSKSWKPPGLPALAFLIKGIKSHRFFCSHRQFLKDHSHQPSENYKSRQHRNWSCIWVLNLEIPIFSQWKTSGVRILWSGSDYVKKGTDGHFLDVCTE